MSFHLFPPDYFEVFGEGGWLMGLDIGLGNDLRISSRRTNKRIDSFHFSSSTLDVYFDIGVLAWDFAFLSDGRE